MDLGLRRDDVPLRLWRRLLIDRRAFDPPPTSLEISLMHALWLNL
jgi:hypothetical protein